MGQHDTYQRADYSCPHTDSMLPKTVLPSLAGGVLCLAESLLHAACMSSSNELFAVTLQ